MKRTMVIADRDEKLQQAFMTVFSKEYYEILYARNGREVEKIAAKLNPDIYLVNIRLPKMNGIETYKALQKQGYLEKASFFFLKDEADNTELLGYQADGVIEKPINFFRVYETVTNEDEVIELTDLVEEKMQEKEEPPPAQVEDVSASPAPSAEAAVEEPPPEIQEVKEAASVEVEVETMIERQLRHAMDTVRGNTVRLQEAEGPLLVETSQSELERQFKAVLNQVMEETASKLSARFAPILTQYVEDYVKQMLLEITEKVIREEIDKLLKESMA